MSTPVDRITAVLREHFVIGPDEGRDDGYQCHHDQPARPGFVDTYETWDDWAAHVAERIAAELNLTEETCELTDGMGGITTNWKTGETTHQFRPCTRLHRWVSPWSAVEPKP